MEKKFYIGCVADDFTGAGDVASFFVKAGLVTVLYNGIPDDSHTVAEGTQAVVIALKSRTQDREQAVADSLRAFGWLLQEGARKLYFKYCSTFDSTKEGNIGPVADAVMEKFGYPYTILCPALPVNGRIVEKGKLYVNGVLLEESSMRNHPLTPMRESELGRLIEMQSRYKGISMAGKTKEQWKKEQETLCRQEGHCYLIPDYYEESHGKEIAREFCDITFYTGGSGLAEHVGRLLAEKAMADRDADVDVSGEACGKEEACGREKVCDKEEEYGKEKACSRQEALLLAGSCSEATLRQIRSYEKGGYPCYRIDAGCVLRGEETAEHIWNIVKMHPGENMLVYSSDSPEQVRKIQEEGKEKISFMLEQLTAELAARAAGSGYRRLIVAGGETSGAVIQRLGYQGFWIGHSIAPGVPVMVPLEDTRMRLALKSGNFGQEDFFSRAVKELEG